MLPLLFLTLISAISAKTISMRTELAKHFDSSVSSPAQMAEITRIMRNIQKLAVKEYYGDSDINLGLPDNDTQVSISMTHPSQSLALSQVFFEGDVLLNSVQALEIYHALLHRASSPGRFKRKLYPRPSFLWDKFPIRYIFSPLLGGVAKERIREGIRMWERQTCISFEERTSTPTGDYLEFFNGQGCYSMVGKQGGRQGISIGKGCEHEGIVAHEIGHALGLWHENSRPDRDDFVKIHPDHIIASTIGNFLTRHERDVEYHGTNYDVGSIMHFGPYAFTNEFETPTLTSVEGGYQRSMGQRDQLTFYDIQMINREYCEDSCTNTLTCYWGGYPDPSDCTRCICPDGMGGRLCERNQDPLNANCGYQVLARKTWREISSPGYPNPGYEVDQKCSWVIRAPGRRRILLEFVEEFDIFCTDTCLDYVEVKNSTEIRKTGMRFCCNEIPQEPIISEGSVMVVIFRSTTAQKPGFKLRFRQIPEATIDISNILGNKEGKAKQKETEGSSEKLVPKGSNPPTQPPFQPSPTTTSPHPPTSPPTTPQPIVSPFTTSATVETIPPSTTVPPPSTTSPLTNSPLPLTSTGTSTQGVSSEPELETTTSPPPPPSSTTEKTPVTGRTGSTTVQGVSETSPVPSLPTSSQSSSSPIPLSTPTTTVSSLPRIPEEGEEGWGPWSDWSPCTKSCGGCGTQKRSRVCDPTLLCIGSPNEYRQCNFEACPADTTCRTLKPGEICQTSFLQYCFRTELAEFVCTTHSCCPPYQKFGKTCKLGLRARRQ